jgi:hypothetical protein
MNNKPNVVVKKEKLKGICISVKRLKNGSIVRNDHPRDGYFYVAWVKKPQKLTVRVSNRFGTKITADRIAKLLNSISRREAIFLVSKLHQKGGNDRSGEISENRKGFAGRSFEWPR